MIRWADQRSRMKTKILFAALSLASTAAGQTVPVHDDGVFFDDKRLKLPVAEGEFEKVVGGAPERHQELADEYSNRVFHWLNLGIVAFSNPNTRRVHAIEFLFAKPPYWGGVVFRGTLVVNGHEITPEMPVASLKDVGFRNSRAGWRWEQGCMYVLVDSFDGEAISSVEIGREETNAVVPSRLKRPATAPCAQKDN